MKPQFYKAKGTQKQAEYIAASKCTMVPQNLCSLRFPCGRQASIPPFWKSSWNSGFLLYLKQKSNANFVCFHHSPKACPSVTLFSFSFYNIQYSFIFFGKKQQRMSFIILCFVDYFFFFTKLLILQYFFIYSDEFKLHLKN